MLLRFLCSGSFSLDVDVFAYVVASNWKEFLAIQEGLLFGVMQIIEESGAQIAFPSETV
jgi:MscS family membrane protein